MLYGLASETWNAAVHDMTGCCVEALCIFTRPVRPLNSLLRLRVQCTAGDNDDCVDQLSFETLISTALLSRYMSLLKQYHRLVVCGPNGTGKTYLALALAHSLASRCSPSRSYIDVAARCCYIHILDSLYFLKKFHVAAFTLNKVAF